MTIGILTAMSVEHDQVESHLTDKSTQTIGAHKFTIGQLGESQIVLMQCGIGKVNAASGVTNLIMSYKPDCVISSGCAGGIDKILHVGDVVVSKQVCYHDVFCGEDVELGQIQGLPRLFSGDKNLLDIACSIASEVNIVPGLICSGDRFVTNRKELDAIKEIYQEGLAVDMESAAIAHVCYLWNTPFVSFRVISDTPGAAENHFQQYLDFWHTMAERSFEVTRSFLHKLCD